MFVHLGVCRAVYCTPNNGMPMHQQAYMRMHQLHKKVVEFVVPGATFQDHEVSWYFHVCYVI